MHQLRRAAPFLAVALLCAGVVTAAAGAARHPRPAHGVEGARYARTDKDRDNEKGENLNTANPAPLPVAQMERALQVKGQASDGVFTASADRTDLAGKIALDAPGGTVPVKPSWELHADLNFQPVADGKAFFNGDIPVLPSEMDSVISAITHHGLVFQAEHQHMYDFSPIVFFVHFRGLAAPVTLATEVHAVLVADGMPLPQQPPANPTTPLDVSKLKSILHGYSTSVGSDGVVTVLVARKNPVFIDGIEVDPSTNIATNVIFEPLDASGSDTAVMPDFGMVASEIDPVVTKMQSLGWDIGCLYNQETAEQPQLYFSHEFKHGDPYQLAAEVRQGLDLMSSQ